MLVPVKKVPDPSTAVRVLADGSGIVTENIKWVINPFDEIAIEEGLRIKEELGGEVVLVAIGPPAWQEHLRSGLAMGADRAILVRNDTGALDPLAIARILAKVTLGEKPDLVILGKQAIDDDSNQVGQMLAEILGWPQATFASEVELTERRCTVVREVDGGLETVAFHLPGVITADLRLDEPRYASLPNIMKARKKEIRVIPGESLGVELKPRLKVRALKAPPGRQTGRKAGSVRELVELLHTEAKVI